MNSPKIPDALFETRHIGSKEKDIRSMMNTLGFTSLNYLTNTIIPENIRYDSLLSLPRPLSETETIKRLQKLARKNFVYRSHIGMGYYGTIVPSVIKRNVFEKSSKATFIERILQQFIMIFSSFGGEGGLFLFVGKKKN